MTSLFGNPSLQFSDNLVKHVLPRVSVDRRQSESVGITLPHLSTSTMTNATAFNAQQTTRRSAVRTTHSTPPSSSRAVKVRSVESKVTKDKRKLSNYYNSIERRQQCRTNQARYRERQRIAQLELEKTVAHLHEEVGTLKRRYRDLSSRERSNQTPWSIMAEVFRLLESSFRSPWRTTNAQEMRAHKTSRQILAVLETSFAYDAAMGDVNGVNALMDQLRSYSQYFGEPTLKLEKIENVAPSVMAATASLTATVTELTLRHIFVHPENSRDGFERHRLVCDRLFGQRLQLSCSLRCLFDEESCRVVRLETQISLVEALLRVLGNLNDVSDVLEHALISSEGVVCSDCIR